MRCVTAPAPDAFFEVDLVSLNVRVTAYTMRHYSSWDAEAARNWQLQGSNGRNKWTALSKHVNDAALVAKGQAHTWRLPAPTKPFRMFRIVLTGPNCTNHLILALSGFELYGIVDGHMPHVVTFNILLFMLERLFTCLMVHIWCTV